MSNVQAISPKLKSNQTIDLMSEQQALIDAELASVNAIEKCADAISGFARFIKKTNKSVTQATVGKLLCEIQTSMDHAIGLTRSVATSHKLAQRAIHNDEGIDYMLSGGTGKDEKGEPPHREL